MKNLCMYLGFVFDDETAKKQSQLGSEDQKLITEFIRTNNFFNPAIPLPKHVAGSTTRSMAAISFKNYVNEFMPEFSKVQFKGTVTRNVMDLLSDVA